MPASSVRSDEDLAVLAQQGDGGAEIELIRRYRWIALSKSRRYFLAGGDAEDVEQEALIGLCNAIRAYLPDRPTPFQSFADLCMTRQVLTAIARASCRKHQPLNRYESINRPDRPSDLTLVQLADASAVDPVEQLIRDEAWLSMQSWLGVVLSSLELEVLRLYLVGKTYDEIAEQLEREVRCVDNALQRAKASIRRRAVVVTGEHQSRRRWSLPG